MNDQLQAQVTTILKQFSAGISAVGDVTLGELPDIAQQYVVYGFWKGLLAVIISVAFMIAAGVTTCLLFKSVTNEYDDNIPAIAVFFLFTVVSFFIAYNSIENLILNVFAPKVWLLLEIKNLIS